MIKQIIAFRVAENLNKAQKKKLHTCENGHNFKKSSECRTCPICEEETKLANPFLEKFSAPARRALEKEGITTLEKSAFCKPEQLLQLHGFGPSSLKVIEELLNPNKGSYLILPFRLDVIFERNEQNTNLKVLELAMHLS